MPGWVVGPALSSGEFHAHGSGRKRPVGIGRGRPIGRRIGHDADHCRHGVGVSFAEPRLCVHGHAGQVANVPTCTIVSATPPPQVVACPGVSPVCGRMVLWR